MAIREEWLEELREKNENLDSTGYSLLITEPEEGFYDCEIWKNGELVEKYAGNYYERELYDLITEAWAYVWAELVPAPI